MKKHKKIRKTPAILLIVLLVISIAGLMIFFISNREGPYEKYLKYNTENKKYGTVEHYEKEDEKFYTSLYYPKTKNENLNNIIVNEYKEFIKNEKANKKEKEILYMDYSSEEVYKQFINLHITMARYDANDKLIKEENKVYCYDLGKEKILTVTDALRNNYKNALGNIEGVDNLDSNNDKLVVGKKDLTIYSDDKLKNKVSINYADNKDLIKLANKNIPSNAPLGVKAPATQPTIDPNKKMIAITLDDGPHKTNTLKVVDMFDKYNGRATFFELGKNVNLYPDVVKTVYEHGFQISSHSWDHPDLRKLDDEKLSKQIIDTQNAIFNITGYEPTTIRPPYGAFNDKVKTACKYNGLDIALWSVDTLDWKLKDATKIKEAIVNGSFDGAVILLHDIHDFSVNGLEMALEELNNQGYQFVTLDTLRAYKNLDTIYR